jgi:hypothetical protein
LRPLALILLLFSGAAYAQTDNLPQKPDTLPGGASLTLDSLEQSFTKKSDSLRHTYVQQKEKLGALKLRYLGRIDSLKRRPKPELPGNPLDSLKPDAGVSRYTQKIDSLDQQAARLQQQTTAQLDSLKGRVNQQLNKLNLPKQADAKVADLTGIMDKVNVPAFDTDVAGKLGVNTAASGLPGTADLPAVNLPNTNLPSVNPDIPGMDVKAPDLKGNIPAAGIDTEKIGDVMGQSADIQKQVKDATGSTEGLGKTLEAKAGEQVKGLPDQKLPEGMPGAMPKTGDEAKQQLVDQAKKEAVNHFAGKEAVLTSAMEKMSKYKQKYSSVSSLKDIKDEKHYNELKGKPLRERLVPALTLQFQSWQDLMLDINPSVGYRLTSHITAGIGWNQRVAFNIPQRRFNEEAKVYGIRTYGEYTFKKGFGLRLDVESMNTPAKQKNPATDAVPARDWVWGALVGIKQKYPIYKKLKGNAQLMYNIFDKDHRSPYLDRVNFRIGLEFTLKKKKAARSEAVKPAVGE